MNAGIWGFTVSMRRERGEKAGFISVFVYDCSLCVFYMHCQFSSTFTQGPYICSCIGTRNMLNCPW